MKGCRVCSHPDLTVIEAELAAGKSLPLLARNYGLDDSSLRRHKREHIKALALKARMDPVTLVQDLLDGKADLEMQLGLGAWRQASDLGVDGAKALMPESKQYAVLYQSWLRTVELIAKLTGASVRPDPKDLLPMWNRMLKVMIDGVQEWNPEYRDRLYLLIEEAEKEAG